MIALNIMLTADWKAVKDIYEEALPMAISLFKNQLLNGKNGIKAIYNTRGNEKL